MKNRLKERNGWVKKINPLTYKKQMGLIDDKMILFNDFISLDQS